MKTLPSRKRPSPLQKSSQKEVNPDAQKFSASHSIDRNLFAYDIAGSIAHAKMLRYIGILKKTELREIEKGLEKIHKEIEKGIFSFEDSLEDIHMHIETRLVELIGETGQKLHTGRSRNDQVVLDFRLYCLDAIQQIQNLLNTLNLSLLELSKKHVQVFIPGYTHLQQAQWIRASHHFLAYINMFERDKSRLKDCFSRTHEMPLGCGALAGTGIGTDRVFLARELGFSKITDNSLDTVSDRDFAAEFLFCLALIAVHLSRFCEEIILWFSQEFDFLEMDSSFCTGSSLLPQKVNPDMAELIRGKTGRFIGNLLNLLTTLKGLPLAYNRDLQEDKESVFDSFNQMKACLSVLIGMVKTFKIKTDIPSRQQNDYMLSTDLADFLVKKNLPFRKAYQAVGQLVGYAKSHKRMLSHLKLSEFKSFSPLFDSSVFKILNPEKSPDSKTSIGGTSLKEISRQIRKWEHKLSARNS